MLVAITTQMMALVIAPVTAFIATPVVVAPITGNRQTNQRAVVNIC